jgi:hypothetical protein
MSSFEIELIETVPGVRMTALSPDTKGAVTVMLTDTGNSRLPEGLYLIPLFLVPGCIPHIESLRRNVFQVRDSCTHVSVETTYGRSKGIKTSYYLDLKVLATMGDTIEEWHCFVGLFNSPT